MTMKLLKIYIPLNWPRFVYYFLIIGGIISDGRVSSSITVVTGVDVMWWEILTNPSEHHSNFSHTRCIPLSLDDEKIFWGAANGVHLLYSIYLDNRFLKHPYFDLTFSSFYIYLRKISQIYKKYTDILT